MGRPDSREAGSFGTLIKAVLRGGAAMDGLRAAKVLVRITVVAVVFCATTLFVIPRLHRHHSEDQGEGAASSDSAASHAKREKDFRLDDRHALLDLLACHPKSDPPGDVIRALLDQAQDGSTPAEYAIGFAYLQGRGVRCNLDHASDYLSAAADADYAPALYLQGVMAETGRGAPRNVEDAIASYRRAAKDGNVQAMTHLGALLAQGDAVEGDPKDAVDWLTKAANLGSADAAVDLGLMYRSGEDYGLEPSDSDAYFWFDVAAQLGDDGAIDLKHSAARHMDREDLADAQRQARRWRPQAPDVEANADFDSVVDLLAPAPSGPETITITPDEDQRGDPDQQDGTGRQSSQDKPGS